MKKFAKLKIWERLIVKIKHLGISPMSITGNVVLGILQNNSTPKLDLLVRESIQNSLDAASNNVNSVTVKYDYKGYSKHQNFKTF